MTARTRIIEAAAELMHLQGVHATSVDQILAKSDTGKSQFYHYFGSKDSIVEEVVRYNWERMFALLAPFLSRVDSVDGIEAMMRAYTAEFERSGARGGCPFGSMISEISETHEGARRLLGDVLEDWTGMLARGLERMVQRGELAADADPEGLAMFLLSVLQGGMVLAAVRHEASPLHRAVDHGITYLRSLER